MTNKMQLKYLWLIPVLLLMFGTIAKRSGVAATISPPSLGVGIGKILPMGGLVVIRRNKKNLTVKPPALDIFQGDAIISNAKGRARILFPGGNEVFVAPSSKIHIRSKLSLVKDFKVRQFRLSLKGKIRAKIKKVQGKKRFRLRIKTSSALINVKGTDVILATAPATAPAGATAAAASGTRVSMLKGVVSMKSRTTGQTMNIAKGREASVTATGTVTPARNVNVASVTGMESTGKTGLGNLDAVMQDAPPVPEAIVETVAEAEAAEETAAVEVEETAAEEEALVAELAAEEVQAEELDAAEADDVSEAIVVEEASAAEEAADAVEDTAEVRVETAAVAVLAVLETALNEGKSIEEAEAEAAAENVEQAAQEEAAEEEAAKEEAEKAAEEEAVEEEAPVEEEAVEVEEAEAEEESVPPPVDGPVGGEDPVEPVSKVIP